MLSVMQRYSLLINSSSHAITEYSLPLFQLPDNTRNIRALDATCVTISHTDAAYDPITHGHGRKLETIKSSFKNGIKSLKKYYISIDTRRYTQLGQSGIKQIKKAEEQGYIFLNFQTWKNQAHKHALAFFLPNKKNNFRVELAHRNNLGMNIDSIYKFQMHPVYAANSVIFFQVKESGGNMRKHDGTRPPVSLCLKDEKEIQITINSENGQVVRQKIARLTCLHHWYNFKVRIVWNRKHPLVQVSINGQIIFQSTASFGAHNSKRHYSKFGIYIPQQKDQDGIRSTFLLFDNVRETHRRFTNH